MKMMKYPNVKNEISPTQSQHDVSPVYGFFKYQYKFGEPLAPRGGVARGRETIQFFLWPWPVTG